MKNCITISAFIEALKSEGIDLTPKMVYHYIKAGSLQAHKDTLRKTRWVIPMSEVDRIKALYAGV